VTTGTDVKSAVDTDVALAGKGISKSYGGVKALDDVSFHVTRGRIHGLVGGNGSGKSTLIRVLAGVLTPDEGQLLTDSTWVDARTHNAARAKASNLHFVHQQNSVFPDLTVAENRALGRGFELSVGGRINWRRQRRRAQDVLDRFELDVAPDKPIIELSAAAQMMVAIARALQDQDQLIEAGGKTGVLVLDEPTASLPKHEVDILLDALRRYADGGQTIVYVSHRLEEITAITTEVTVLRNGVSAARLEGSEITHDSLVEGITGQKLVSDSPPTATRAAREAKPVLEVTDQNKNKVEFVPGEIVGVAGLLGSGRSSLLKRMFGAADRGGLEVRLDGKDVKGGDVKHSMNRGLGFVPENRLAEAAFADLSIAENISISDLRSYSKSSYVSASGERNRAKVLMKTFRVRAPSAAAPLTALSGGNQQKVILARWLQRKPKVLLLDEPSQGVDIGARAEIHSLVRTAAAQGAAVVVVSSDFEELALLCHRAVIVSEGAVVSHVDGPLTAERLNNIVYAKEKSL
jgi:ribose transport system ATP-binding protein